MRKLFLVLTTLTAFNFALADENTPVNFHKDQRKGQVNVSIEMNSSGVVTSFDQKICFIQGGLRDSTAPEKFEAGCRAKKTKDSSTDLEYLVMCLDRPDTRMRWIRLSENEFSFTSKSTETEVKSTYKYAEINCDSDAVRK